MMTLVILLSIGAAFATRPAKVNTSLYFWNGTAFMPAGTMGVNYFCQAPSAAVCVYTLSGGVYTPFTTNAQYVPIGLDAKPQPPVKKDK